MADEAAQYYSARNLQRQFTNTGPMAGYETSGLVGTGRQLRRTTGGSYLHQSDYSGSSRTAEDNVPQPIVMRPTTRATRYTGSGRRYATPALQRFKQGDLKPTFSGIGRMLGKAYGAAGEVVGNVANKKIKEYQDYLAAQNPNLPPPQPPTLPPPQTPVPPPPAPGGPNWPAPTTAAPKPPAQGWNPPAQGNSSGWNAPRTAMSATRTAGRVAGIASAASAAGAAGASGAGAARTVANAGRLLARVPKVIPV